ncbi:MAG: 16S rRNA (cytosine(967)-C(5))-methyltransferase RsmB [Gammaproteobacteria bacterium]|nr:16S rRNA (cytosine(967)-C(5))-methyltransferase RsmB [Gammaproteobacteria bacterium]
MKNDNPRWIALQVMLQVLSHGRSLDDIFVSDWYRSLTASARDLAFSRELAYGLCRWYFALSSLLASRLQKPLRQRDRDVEVMLLLGLYQLLIMQTGAHAAVNETVSLAQMQNKHWARGLINAVLRTVIRDGVELTATARAQSYPDWMLARVSRDWSDRAEQLLSRGNERPPMTLRVDTRQSGVDEVIETLAAQGIEAEKHPVVESAIVLTVPCDVVELAGFAEGIVSVQDASSQIAAQLLACEAGAQVLDACAAPGGKGMHLLQRYDAITLDMLDSSESRLERVRQNLERIGRPARILVGDATRPESWFSGEGYDAILADLPCSASGVMRRHPDIKLLRRESDIMPLLGLQRKIIDALWRLLKPGGTMLYCTCSIFKDENEVQIAKFLERHPDCVETSLQQQSWGEARPHGRQILTGSDNMDGFYYALLTRSGKT